MEKKYELAISVGIIGGVVITIPTIINLLVFFSSIDSLGIRMVLPIIAF